MAIKYLIDETYSKRDLYGNVYCYAHITRISDNATLEGAVDSEGSVAHLLYHAGAIEFGKNETHTTQRMLPVREFNRLIKGKRFIHQETINQWVNGAEDNNHASK